MTLGWAFVSIYTTEHIWLAQKPWFLVPSVRPLRRVGRQVRQVKSASVRRKPSNQDKYSCARLSGYHVDLSVEITAILLTINHACIWHLWRGFQRTPYALLYDYILVSAIKVVWRVVQSSSYEGAQGKEPGAQVISYLNVTCVLACHDVRDIWTERHGLNHWLY